MRNLFCYFAIVAHYWNWFCIVLWGCYSQNDDKISIDLPLGLQKALRNIFEFLRWVLDLVLFFQFFKKICYFLFTIYRMSFIECDCDRDRSLGGNCDDAGKCSCKPAFDGDKCNTCTNKYFGFPRCQGIVFFSIFQKNMLFSLYYLSDVFYRVQLWSRWITRWQLWCCWKMFLQAWLWWRQV